MNWLNHVDWAAVVAALIALYNAVMHRATQSQVEANHKETMDTLTGEVPKP